MNNIIKWRDLNYKEERAKEGYLEEYMDLNYELTKSEALKKMKKQQDKSFTEILALLSEKSTDKDIDEYFKPLGDVEMTQVIYDVFEIIRNQSHDDRDIFRALKKYWLTQNKINIDMLKKYNYSGEYKNEYDK